VYRIDGFVCCSLVLACLVRVRAQASKPKEQQTKPIESRFRDDSGSKLRDKEQQRLSSK